MRRGIGVAIVALLVGGLMAPAGAEEGEEFGETRQLQVFQRIGVKADGTVEMGPIVAREDIYDSDGNFIGSERIEGFSNRRADRWATGSGGGPSSFKCVNNRNRRRLVIGPPTSLTYSDPKRLHVGMVWHPYIYNKARKLGPRRARYPSKQYLYCSTGGADAQNGWRLRFAGPGQAYWGPNKSRPSRRSRRIAWKWPSRPTGEEVRVRLGFSVPAHRAVRVAGSIEQTRRARLKGSFVGPYETRMDELSYNAMAGWWDWNCRPCYPWSGSPDFQGSIAEGLWEVRQSGRTHYFYLRPFVNRYCSSGRCP